MLIKMISQKNLLIPFMRDPRSKQETKNVEFLNEDFTGRERSVNKITHYILKLHNNRCVSAGAIF